MTAFRLTAIGGLIMLLCSSHTHAASKVTHAVNSIGRQKRVHQEARQIWEQAIAAKGGRERLHAVQNLVISTVGKYTTSSGKTNTVRTEGFFVLPNKVWAWSDYRPDVFGLTVEMLNFDSNVRYFINSDNPPPVPLSIPSNETSAARTYGLLAYLLETKWVKPVLVSASTAWIGRRTVDVVHTELRDDVKGYPPDDKRIDFAFDRETHLLVRVSYYHTRGGKDVLDAAENLSDYTEVSGIKVPQRREVDDSVDKISIQINVEFNEDFFNKPPSIADGPEAWKVAKSGRARGTDQATRDTAPPAVGVAERVVERSAAQAVQCQFNGLTTATDCAG